MIIYNVTIQLDHEIVTDWLEWMQQIHIPEVMQTGFFTDYQLLRLMDDKPEICTYAVQYFCRGMDELAQYQADHAPALQVAHRERYEGKFVAFRTLLERVGGSANL